MLKRQRTPQEIGAVCDDNPPDVLDMIARDGSKRFSIRKLAPRLDIAANTIDNDYRNQDELVLCRGAGVDTL